MSYYKTLWIFCGLKLLLKYPRASKKCLHFSKKQREKYCLYNRGLTSWHKTLLGSPKIAISYSRRFFFLSREKKRNVLRLAPKAKKKGYFTPIESVILTLAPQSAFDIFFGGHFCLLKAKSKDKISSFDQREKRVKQNC